MKKCWLYWIHLPEHTDIFSEGYVGITTLGTEERFKRHQAAALTAKTNAKRSQRINHCINKYGTALVVETMLVADEAYCLDIENKLRPTTHVGWNLAVGGKAPGAGAVRTEESRRRMSLAQRDHKVSSEAKAAVSVGVSAYHASQPDWARGRANKAVWLEAARIYEWFITTNGVGGRRSASTALGLPPDSLVVPLKKMKAGWVPSQDEEYLAWQAANKMEATYAEAAQPV